MTVILDFFILTTIAKQFFSLQFHLLLHLWHMCMGIHNMQINIWTKFYDISLFRFVTYWHTTHIITNNNTKWTKTISMCDEEQKKNFEIYFDENTESSCFNGICIHLKMPEYANVLHVYMSVCVCECVHHLVVLYSVYVSHIHHYLMANFITATTYIKRVVCCMQFIV